MRREQRERPVRFPFGHGLGYTRFAIGAPRLADRFVPGGTLRIEVPIENARRAAAPR